MPARDATYFNAHIETMARADLEALQLERLLEVIPIAYERAPLIREAWEDAKVHPRDIRTLDDFRERVPFIDKDAVRRFRDERGDPRSEEHTSELQSHVNLVCRLLLEKKKKKNRHTLTDIRRV